MSKNDVIKIIWFLIVSVLIIGAVIVYLLTNPDGDELPELTAYEIPERVVIYEAKEVIIANAEPVKHLTDEDIMAMVVSAEAKGEEMVDKVAVASVILNRCDYYGLTVESVVNAPNQFTSYKNEKPSKECYKAVAIAQENRDLFPSRMMFFRNEHYHVNDKLEDYMPIGNHYFSLLKAE